MGVARYVQCGYGCSDGWMDGGWEMGDEAATCRCFCHRHRNDTGCCERTGEMVAETFSLRLPFWRSSRGASGTRSKRLLHFRLGNGNSREAGKQGSMDSLSDDKHHTSTNTRRDATLRRRANRSLGKLGVTVILLLIDFVLSAEGVVDNQGKSRELAVGSHSHEHTCTARKESQQTVVITRETKSTQKR